METATYNNIELSPFVFRKLRKPNGICNGSAKNIELSRFL